MSAVWFRVVAEDGAPTGYVGLAFGASSEDVFWAIDEFVDPYSVQIKTARTGGFCLLIEDRGGPDGEVVASEHETSERMPHPGDDGWRTPSWCRGAQFTHLSHTKPDEGPKPA